MFKLLIVIFGNDSSIKAIHSQVIDFNTDEERILAANNILEKNDKHQSHKYEVILL